MAAPVSTDWSSRDIQMAARKHIQDACLEGNLDEKDIWEPMKTL